MFLRHTRQRSAAAGHPLRSTVLFAAVSGEEQGLLGSTHLLGWTKEKGYTVGGMLDNDIVGADTAPDRSYRVRLFSGNGEIEDCNSPSRELARAIEEIDNQSAIRLIFRVDRYGRGGDHYSFYKAGVPPSALPSHSKTTRTSTRLPAQKTELNMATSRST
jgi:Zn-dependent M28 family amino/carboxypeptidase